MAGGEGARENAGVGEGNQCDTGGGPDQMADVLPGDSTDGREGESFRQCADHADVIGETGGSGQDYGRDNGHQNAGNNRYPEPEGDYDD